jgi:TDG/mug DNA glycosylase family protein
MPEDTEHGLSHFVGDDPVVLILGSFPSRKSLERKQYYANPQNQFWRIRAAFFCFEDPGAIEWNSEELKHHHIALWDVIASRKFQQGSGDRDIKDTKLNDIGRFVYDHPTIRFIGLNGGKAGECFRKLVRKETIPEMLVIQVLPSSSPANATITLEKKCERWRVILDYLP